MIDRDTIAIATAHGLCPEYRGYCYPNGRAVVNIGFEADRDQSTVAATLARDRFVERDFRRSSLQQFIPTALPERALGLAL